VVAGRGGGAGLLAALNRHYVIFHEAARRSLDGACACANHNLAATVYNSLARPASCKVTMGWQPSRHPGTQRRIRPGPEADLKQII
jgi:hypothetical protein